MAIEQLSIVKETVPTFRIPINIYRVQLLTGIFRSFTKAFVDLVLFFSSAPTQNNQSKKTISKEEDSYK